LVVRGVGGNIPQPRGPKRGKGGGTERHWVSITHALPWGYQGRGYGGRNKRAPKTSTIRHKEQSNRNGRLHGVPKNCDVFQGKKEGDVSGEKLFGVGNESKGAQIHLYRGVKKTHRG